MRTEPRNIASVKTNAMCPAHDHDDAHSAGAHAKKPSIENLVELVEIISNTSLEMMEVIGVTQ
jgi:hypothetical protein